MKVIRPSRVSFAKTRPKDGARENKLSILTLDGDAISNLENLFDIRFSWSSSILSMLLYIPDKGRFVVFKTGGRRRKNLISMSFITFNS